MLDIVDCLIIEIITDYDIYHLYDIYVCLYTYIWLHSIHMSEVLKIEYNYKSTVRKSL